ncbi:DoxX family protein [Polynucleobacter sp. MWH-Braz-FAM2G]|uniref:DoxX family protein n=1 Tax=Polynucleobacter sp. MWH-Braz-FAM2G TaxID=1855883 RepID=UPI001BFD5689|nr:DoxX family protein [Polynucleobacter sp. MWH-Braz-FAM2G]QWD91291.1 DoxX family protein [Polynucleobacter sp. MWH-Braz-FAM2G]
MDKSQSVLNLIGRIAIATLFLPAGILKLAGIEDTGSYFGSLHRPVVAILVWLVMTIEILGGLALIAGYRTRLAAIVLATYTLGASLIGHSFWSAPEDAALIAQLIFVRNMAILGGLLVLAASGGGAYSLDARNKKVE